MLLKRIELAGFKSFARPTTLEFTTPITGIVGPNGSGKSNIAEAVRFVLGEQSMKSLRSKRGEDLIFNGSKTAARLNRASVAIVFDNTGRVFDLDFDEVEVKRVVYRDATNQYFINGNKVRLKDVIEILAAIHIGVSSHHIISQGEADRILNSSIKERRTMIEDALGLRIFHYKKTESEKKLVKTEENMQKVESLRREIAPHLKFLEKQVEKVRQAEQLKRDLKDQYTEYLQREEVFLGQQKSAIDKEVAGPHDELRQVEADIEEKTAAFEKLDAQQEKNQALIDLETQLRTTREEKDTLSRQLGRLEGMFEYEERRLKKQEERQAQLEKERSEQVQTGDLTIPASRLKQFVNEVKELIGQGEETSDVMFMRDILRRVRKAATYFYEEYESSEAPAQLKAEEEVSSRDDYNHITTQKTEVEQKLNSLKEKEHELYKTYRTTKDTIEQERSSERDIERELFTLRGRKTELLTRLELIKVKQERLSEEERRFNEERTEAGILIGLEVVQYTLDGVVVEGHFDEIRRDHEQKRKKIERIKIKIEEIGGGGEEVMREYEETKERDAYLEKEVADLQQSVTALTTLIQELGEKINTEFKDGVKKINTQFQDLFSAMFDGGVASIKLVTPPPKKRRSALDEGMEEAPESVEEEEEQEEGVDIVVTLPQKRLKGLHMLSGGERALTSIALIFAITRVNPPPFIVLDETDAALDEANARKYGMMVERLADTTQFVIITHTRETMAKAQVLYGVTAATDGISRLLSIKFDEAASLTGGH